VDTGGEAFVAVGDGGGGVVEDCEAHVLKEWAAVLWWDLRRRGRRGQGKHGREIESRRNEERE
jgi:hypothetical protein